MVINLKHGNYTDCSIKLSVYHNGRTSLSVMTSGIPLLKASVNLPDHELPTGCIFIKNWSENEGILSELIRHNIIEDTDIFVSSGYVDVNVCKLL